MMTKDEIDIIKRLRWPLSLIVLMWIIKVYEVSLGIHLTRWGIYPRELDGLIGIITGPFIHSDWEHLMSNSFPLLLLLSTMVIFFNRIAAAALVVITLFTGFTVWLFARESYHVGASGVVYGLIAFIFWSGIFRRNLRSIILAIIVLILFGTYFHGIIPNLEKLNVSFESHLFGGIVGIFTAFLFKNVKEPEDEEDESSVIPAEEEEKVYFLPRDVFEKTKMERYLESLQEDE